MTRIVLSTSLNKGQHKTPAQLTLKITFSVVGTNGCFVAMDTFGWKDEARLHFTEDEYRGNSYNICNNHNRFASKLLTLNPYNDIKQPIYCSLIFCNHLLEPREIFPDDAQGWVGGLTGAVWVVLKVFCTLGAQVCYSWARFHPQTSHTSF